MLNPIKLLHVKRIQLFSLNFQVWLNMATDIHDITRNIEAMSMSSIVTDIATPPPPPPPLEIERWRTLSKGFASKSDQQSNGGFFSRHFSSLEKDFPNPEKFRGGEFHFSRFSRESSVASDRSDISVGSTFSIVSKSSTLSRIFSRKSKNCNTYTRSASIDSFVNFGTLRRNKQSVSTPATPITSNPYATWRRRGRDKSPATPSFKKKFWRTMSPEKQRVGKQKYFQKF